VVKKISKGWSPEQISGRIVLDNEDWSINHESIYQFLYSERSDLIKHLRQGRKRRLKKGQAKNKRCVRVPDRTMIDERPAYINERKVYGHWEADTMISRKSKPCVMGVLERKSGYCILEKLSGKTAPEMHRGLVERLSSLPGKLVKTITYDNGTENVLHKETNEELRTDSYFCNPYHSWEKGSVENLFGLVRQYLLKGSDLDKISKYGLKAIQNQLNNRPRKRLGYKTPAEVFCNLVA
jgi:IS30 family transposase